MNMRSIQALRALAALLVVGDHIPRLEAKLFPNGFMHGFGSAGAIGVDLFFVISGFIMITTTYKAFGTPNASTDFLARRFLRIYPAYWAALIPFLAIGVLFPAALYVAPMTTAALTTSFLLLPHSSGPLMFVAWSLEYELYFYLVFALALYFAKSKLPLILGIWSAITLLCNALVAAHASDFVAVQFVGSPLAFEFMGGGVIGYLILHKRIFAPRSLLLLGASLALVVAIYSSRFDGFGTLELTWFRVLAAGPAMMLIVYGCVTLEQLGQLTPHRFSIALGDASYTMYLWHGMLLGAYGVVFARVHIHGPIADALYIVGGFAVVIVGSLAVYRIVESPLTRAAKRVFRVGRNPRRVAVSPR